MQQYIELKQQMEFVLGMMAMIPVFLCAAFIGFYLASWHYHASRK